MRGYKLYLSTGKFKIQKSLISRSKPEICGKKKEKDGIKNKQANTLALHLQNSPDETIQTAIIKVQ